MPISTRLRPLVRAHLGDVGWQVEAAVPGGCCRRRGRAALPRGPGPRRRRRAGTPVARAFRGRPSPGGRARRAARGRGPRRAGARPPRRRSAGASRRRPSRASRRRARRSRGPSSSDARRADARVGGSRRCTRVRSGPPPGATPTSSRKRSARSTISAKGPNARPGSQRPSSTTPPWRRTRLLSSASIRGLADAARALEEHELGSASGRPR